MICTVLGHGGAPYDFEKDGKQVKGTKYMISVSCGEYTQQSESRTCFIDAVKQGVQYERGRHHEKGGEDHKKDIFSPQPTKSHLI